MEDLQFMKEIQRLENVFVLNVRSNQIGIWKTMSFMIV